MHFCDVTLTAKKPLSEAYPKNLKTIGDHLRKKRLDLKLYQKDVAKLIGVTTDTIINWEKNRVGPVLRFIPMISKFLGYNPFEIKSNTLGDRIKWYRKQRGMSQKQLAKVLDIDPGTLSRWEKGESMPNAKVMDLNSLRLTILISSNK